MTPLAALVLFAIVAAAQANPSATNAVAVKADTLRGKMLLGYQGWFGCPNDGSPLNRWFHWFRRGTPVAANLTVDMWPDTSELEADELFPTQLTGADGRPAMLYSAYKAKTVARHFKWMQEAGIDGVALQRFVSQTKSPVHAAFCDQVARNVRDSAERHGRIFAIEYDTAAGDAEPLMRDWQRVVDELRVTESPRYLRHNGKPVLFVWGLGFKDRQGTAAQAQALVDWLKRGPVRYQVTIVGGVPSGWRSGNGDAHPGEDWARVFRSFDVISPWTVGRYRDNSGADNYRQKWIEPDMAEARRVGAEYMPVVFPGFSWHNLHNGALNQIPRQGGRFYWRQVSNAVAAGATMMKTAMFDEVDEGTAMFKVVSSTRQLPQQGSLVALDADGLELPSDWYLRLAGQASRLLRGEMQPSAELPLQASPSRRP